METEEVGTNSIEDISVIVPTYNEESCIPFTLESLMKLAFKEIIVADSGSLDGTPEIAERYGAHVVVQKGGGYGATVLKGLHEAKGDFVVIFRVGFNYNPNDISKLVNVLKMNNDVGMVVGSRTNLEKSVILKFINKTYRLLFGVSTTDIDSPFIALRKSNLLGLRLTSSDFFSRLKSVRNCLERGTKSLRFQLNIIKIGLCQENSRF